MLPVISGDALPSPGDSAAKIGYTFDGLSGTGLYGTSDSPMHPSTSLNLFVDSQLSGFVSNETVKIPAKNPVTGDIVEEGSDSRYDNHLIRLKELKESRLSILEETKPIPINMLNLIYPVGTIYSNGNDPRDPKEIFQWPESSWRRYGPGRSIMAATGDGASADPWLTVPSDLKIILGRAGEPYGDYCHKLVMEEMPSHSHGLSFNIQNNVEIWGSSEAHGILKQGDGSKKEGSLSGGDKPHNNVHPVIIAHVWIRES